MPTTTNYGWTTPADTDLVKDGASAIRTLGNGVDTSLKTVSDGRGLVHINTTSFSAVASQAISSCFSSTYKNYKIILNITSVSADNNIFIKLRSGSTDSSATYVSNRVQCINGTVSGAYGAPETNGFFIFNGDSAVGSGYYNASIDLSNPFETLATTAQVFSIGLTNAGSYFLNLGGTMHETTSSYDSFNIIASTGNMTGSVRVYGYRNG